MSAEEPNPTSSRESVLPKLELEDYIVLKWEQKSVPYDEDGTLKQGGAGHMTATVGYRWDGWWVPLPLHCPHCI